MRVLSRPYNFLIVSAVFVLLFSIFTDKEQTIDLHLHDTVFVIANYQLLVASAIILFIFSLVYKLLTKILFSKILTWIHVLSTTLFFLTGVAMTYPIPFLTEIITVAGIVAIFSQPVFVVNILAGLIKLLVKRN